MFIQEVKDNRQQLSISILIFRKARDDVLKHIVGLASNSEK